MNDTRPCAECGTALTAADSQSLCPACVFRRLARTGSTIETGGSGSAVQPAVETRPSPKSNPEGDHDTDFYSEYELLEEIGRGGMGVIYRAHQASLNRIVALKVIHAASHLGESARRRFQAEVEVAARLSHPNIVPIFDTGEMDGSPCFSMELFRGGTLAARMRDFEAHPDAGARLLVKVARAVAFAHQRGVIHRDLKPGNILLDETGEPHVGDFGLAKQLDSNSDLTRSGAVIGSPNYMSPEQAAGKTGSLTVATDIYSLGVILYQMLTGRTPFAAETAVETMRLVVEHEPQRPSSLAARADRDLETICLKCLQKDPEHRYHSAEALAEDLDRWLRQEPILARPVPGWERFQKWVRRRPALAGVSALLLASLLAGISGVLWQWREAEQARRDEADHRRHAEAALARSALALAEVALREGNSPAAHAALESVPAEYREATWTYLLGEADTSRPLPDIGVRRIADLAGDPSRPSVFAAADDAGTIVLFDVQSGLRLLEFAPGFDTTATNAELRLAFSRDGARIALSRTGPGGIVLHDAGDGRKLTEWSAPAANRIDFNPEGTLLLLTTQDREFLEMRDAATGAIRWRQKDAYHAARFTADGRHVASYCWAQNLRLLRVDDGAEVLRFPGDYFYETSSQPGGDLLVAGNPLGYVRGFDLHDGRQRFEFQPHVSKIERVLFLPGGERFLTAATLPDGQQALRCWESRDGRSSQAMTGGRGPIRVLALHPLSGELVVCGPENRFWNVATLAPVRIIRSRNAHPSAVFWGGDDTLFAPGDSGNGSAELRSVLGIAPKTIWTPPDDSHGQPSVSADGRRAAMGRYNSASRIAVLEREGDRIRQIASLNPHCVISHVRISPKGDRVAVVQSDLARLVIVDVDTDKPAVELEVPHMNTFSDVAWLEDGASLAGLVTSQAPRSNPDSVEQVVLWDMSTGRLTRAVTNRSVTSVACAAPDGRRFVEAGADRNVRIRDSRTLEVHREFRVHNAPITALAWHPTRPILATASEDLVIRLWNLETGARLEELRGPLSPPSVLSFNPGGTRLATASRDQVVRIWEPRALVP